MPIHGSMAFVSVAPKKAQKTSFVEPLAKFISREYQQDPADIKEPVKELTELRNACVVAAPYMSHILVLLRCAAAAAATSYPFLL